MSEKYIEWELKNNLGIFRKISGEGFIDRRVLRHVICNVNKPESIAQEQFEVILNAIAEETDLIPPAADVTPMVHGHWVRNKKGYVPLHRCSICGEDADDDNNLTPYCPYCGAKMDESEDKADV